MESVRWGMIGCGDVTEKKSAPSFNKINGSSLHGVTSRNRSRASAYAERHHVPKVYDSADELVGDPEISAVYIATPPSSHAGYAIMAMRAGKPVYVEKPMASDYQGCLEMNQVSAETGMPIFVAYYRRSMEYFVKVKWIKDLPLNEAVSEVGFFGNQNSVCKPTTPKWNHTVDRLKIHFGVQ